MEKSISNYDFERFRKIYQRDVKNMFNNSLLHVVEKSYNLLKEKNHYYYTSKNRMENIKNNLFSDDHSIYAGILEEDLCNKGRVLYINSGEAQFIVIFIDEEFESSSFDSYNEGVLVYIVYNEIDIDCIEKSWNVDNTEKWVTKLDLTRETFTDVTKYSQKVGDHTVCKRPTVKRVIDDLNSDEFMYYVPMFSTSQTSYYAESIGDVEYVMNSLILLGVRLEIEGVEI